MMTNKLYIGLDVGSTTVKAAILDEAGQMVFSRYERHFSDVGQTVRAMLEAIFNFAPEAEAALQVTGSSGLAVARQMELPFIQEVIACSEAVERWIPRTDVAVELGGEDAKITYFGAAPELRMNGTCAGGTGAFIDQMAILLRTDAAGLNELAAAHREIYPIASRCGVFAKTDIQPLLNEGAAREDVAASVFQAVVNQTIAGLACGKPIRGNVAFLGGPLSFLPELRRRFIETLRLAPENIIVPEQGQYFVAMGAALAAEREPLQPMSALYGRLSLLGAGEHVSGRLAPLFSSGEEYREFQERHAARRAARGDLAAASGPCFLGVDAGSTTTKLALIDGEGRLLYSFYGSNGGNPLDSTVRALRDLYGCLPGEAVISRAVVTGYGEALLKAALKIDEGEIETVAHHKGAEYFLPGVDFVLDIGGQDMKSMQIRDNVINNIMLNEACSSGCGSFIETLAESLSLALPEFVRKGLFAEAPADLGTRCTVFMNSKIKQVQKEGAEIGDIAAGIAYAVVKNALFKVIRLHNIAQVGDRIVVQGGTFLNDAVLRALEILTGREVIRPDIAGIMGAFGAALTARERADAGDVSTILRPEELADFSARIRSRHCGICGNNCLLTINIFSDGREFITGNRCEKGASGEQSVNELPNLYDYKWRRLFKYYTPRKPEKSPRGKVGIPRCLNMYEHYPFWFTFFDQLGFQVVLSARSSKKIFEMGMESVASESLCYPAKLANGHVRDLLNKGVGFIFYPCLPNEIQEQAEANNNYNCPVVTSYPEALRANVDELRSGDVKFLYPFLPMHSPEHLKTRLTEELKPWRIPAGEIARAVDAAYAEQAAMRRDIQAQGEETLRYLAASGKKGIILCGRPYHIDPEVHHGIPEMITGLGLAVLTEDSVSHLGQIERPLRVLDQWVYHSRLYDAAGVAVARPDLELVQLNSFGCGLDAVTTDQVQEILSQYHKTYTLIKIDEINNLGAVRIRVRSLLAAMIERERKGIAPEKLYDSSPRISFTEEMKRDYVILCPQMSPLQFELLEAAMRGDGFRLEVLPDMSSAVVEEGLKYVHNDACYPSIIVVGQIMAALLSGRYDINRTAVVMSQTGGGCRASNYVAFIRKALRDAGMEHIPVIALSAQGIESNPGFRLSKKLIFRCMHALIYGDLLMRLTYATRPYEKKAGETQTLLSAWMEKLKRTLAEESARDYARNIRRVIAEFDRIERTGTRKPKVGVVGEILVKFHPYANNNIVDVLEAEGAEAVVPDLTDFLLYSLYGAIYRQKKMAGTHKSALVAHYLIMRVEWMRRVMRSALKKSRHFSPPATIYRLASMTEKVMHLGHQMGEGWFLTGEMLELLHSGVDNVVCLQPFACLPNHITGKAMIRELRRRHPLANIVPIDYDPGASSVNQLNRIKLMLSLAFRNMKHVSIIEDADGERTV
ncbi:MAG: 2-hydroxyacyl-CoA dehydratase [Gracilibacteraceae bacterium]|jgi:predicted CoA-substrate-specific enzyme activase|nr:2-hydroxyacyl-CoA dehydratase [Gracilibacteraceae bacterium]